MVLRKKHKRIFRESVETLCMTLIVFVFMVTFVVQGYKVYGSCMEPNLVTGERLLGNKFVYRFDHPTRGDIIVFKYPPDPKKTFIKRIVGMPGETIRINQGKVYINDQPLDEQFYVKNIPHEDYSTHKVPEHCVFVLGDNRDQSNDSRFWGDLPLQNIQAKAWIRYWPLARAHVFE